jgi:hypothetical protein
MRKSLTAITLALCFCAAKMEAQVEAKKLEDPDWKTIVMVDYKPGHDEKAQKMIQDYFMPASEKAGTPGPEMVVELSTGKYDRMYVWDMEDGVEGMNWDISPNGAKWWNAMAEIAGSEEKAQEIWQDYMSCIANSSTTIGRAL